MPTRRRFPFRVSTLTRSAKLLKNALHDSNYRPALELRLGTEFVTGFEAKIIAVTGNTGAQSGQTGNIATLTKSQKDQYDEMDRLASGARRTARLAFLGHKTLLSEEFQVGDPDSWSLAAEIERATKTHTAAIKYADALQKQGWIVADTTQLGEAIAAMSDIDIDQEGALDERLGMTDAKVIAANDLYEACLAIQNSARLQYPDKKDANGNAMHVTVRARFLLDEFPPRDRSADDEDEDEETETPAAPDA